MAFIERATGETHIRVNLNINGSGHAKIKTPIGFLNHLLTSLSFHAKFDLDIEAQGDTEVDNHHTVEDIGIALGKAFHEELGDRTQIRRFGFFLMVMDDALVEVALDLAERAFLHFEVNFERDKIGELETELIEEFWRAFVSNSFITLHISKRRGKNAHHIAEAIFKGVGRALRMALERDEGIPSTKGAMKV
ncbi:MAG: imidazoleglycerol-phosphate dehydratase HisB [Synergistetes bacterium]|nr:imidazoleglycerol-phosphate dehydratase HisB [Synergistota bacterium]